MLMAMMVVMTMLLARSVMVMKQSTMIIGIQILSWNQWRKEDAVLDFLVKDGVDRAFINIVSNDCTYYVIHGCMPLGVAVWREFHMDNWPV